MKKILFAVMAMVAIGMTSCGNKTQQGEATDSAAVAEAAAGEVAESTLEQLGALLKEGNAEKLQKALEEVKAKVSELIKENPEVAKEYVAKVQQFLKDNAEQVKAVVGDNAAVAAAVSAITDVEPESVVNGLLEQVGDQAADAKDAAVDAANAKVNDAKASAEEKANEVKEAVRQKAEDAKNDAKQKANDAVDNAAKNIKKGLGI